MLIYQTVRSQKHFTNLKSILNQALNFQQGEGESLSSYTNRFKQHKDLVQKIITKKVWDPYTEKLPEYKSEMNQAKKQAMKDEMFSVFMTYLFLDGADKCKYGYLLDGFASQFSLGNGQWLTTMEFCITNSLSA